ncbi:TadE/TadG family type IV pilus assembly protein [Rhizobium sp. C1]|uniref:TadE/TadG family type IV pilus assembly protein n=1 Tax=Rhizobium sp. C1 TaxID=1349799 RepID=UPI001E2E0543|nr:TadE/TadG family type IV pilus assembly protein [Rhizobium sp. C1]MCD2179868.1 pilus assembly protein [Rhizobium sp. C1]
MMSVSKYDSIVSRFRRQRAGAAAVEFAVVFPLMLVIFAATVDLGFAYYQKSRIGSAISAAAYYAVRNGSSLNSGTADAMRTTLQGIIRSTLGLSTDITVTVLINNSTNAADASNYFCVTGYPPAYSSTGTSQSGCSGNLTSGKFVTIRVTEQLKPLILPPGFLASVYGLDRSVIARVI